MDRKSCGPLRVALLAGGLSAEREVSLASGRRAAAALQSAGHRIELIDPAETRLEHVDWRRFDGFFLALHGGAGEDGRVQQWLEARGIPYTGSSPRASRRAINKAAAKRRFRRCGVPTPDCAIVPPAAGLPEIRARAARLGYPLVVKPNGQGSSLGVGVARSERELAACVAAGRRFDPVVLAERYVAGREMTVSVLDRRALPVLEIVGFEDVFDYDAKYTSSVIEYRFQTGLSPMKVEEIGRTAVAAAAALGTCGLVRVDLIVDARQRPWVLEVNTLPGLTEHSLAPAAAARAGLDMAALCEWMLRDARRCQAEPSIVAW